MLPLLSFSVNLATSPVASSNQNNGRAVPHGQARAALRAEKAKDAAATAVAARGVQRALGEVSGPGLNACHCPHMDPSL